MDFVDKFINGFLREKADEAITLLDKTHDCDRVQQTVVANTAQDS
jgi:hypothetical protein